MAPLTRCGYAAFNVVSVVTTTGYATADYASWGNAAVGLFFGLMFVGGCTGSTTGGMKIFRFQVMARLLRSHFLRVLYPRGVFEPVYAGRLLPDDVVGSVVGVLLALLHLLRRADHRADGARARLPDQRQRRCSLAVQCRPRPRRSSALRAISRPCRTRRSGCSASACCSAGWSYSLC